MDFWFPLNNPTKPCSVHHKISWYIATTNIKITDRSYLSVKRQMSWNVKNRTFLVSMDVMSLDEIYRKTRVLKLSLKHMKISTGNLSRHITCRMFRLILKKNFLHFNGKHYLQTHGNCNGRKDSSFDSFANIFVAYIETRTLSKTVFKPTVWKCYIDDIFPYGHLSLHWTSKLTSPNY